MTATAKNMAKNITVIPPIDDEARLTELLEREDRIERAQRNAWYETGLELKKIRDSNPPLYKVKRADAVAGRYSFQTFEEYVEGRWELGVRRVNQMIEVTAAAEEMGKIFPILPTSESHVRELLKLETDEDRAEVWQRVIEDDPKPTAKVIESHVKKYLAEQRKEYITLDEWEDMTADDRKAALALSGAGTMNKQDNDSIEWAQWSWNPVTGCKHECPYCYARDIAERFYPHGFRPALYPRRLSLPGHTTVPDAAKVDVAFKNIFTCSMADLFGRWVPAEWIEAVLDVAEEQSQWNFLMLTKFPQRVSEFGTLPENVWMGTTVDCQERVANAEKAFAKMGGGIKWLSIEPMLTSIRIKKPELFNWVVVGGASRSTQTPAWSPPFKWVYDLHRQCEDANIPVYHKANLFSSMTDEVRMRAFPWQKAKEPTLPVELRYLNMN